MILKDGTYYNGGIRNSMFLLLAGEIVSLYDSVYISNGSDEEKQKLEKLKAHQTAYFKKHALI